jgi:4-hydroxy-3-methylbut-2-enyl diphosphate reductase
MDQTKKKTAGRSILYIVKLLANLNIVIAAGAVSMYYVSCALQGFTPRISGMLMVFLYFLSMYLWNSLASLESTKHLGFSRYRFYREHTSLLYAIAGAGIALLCAISKFENRYLFYLMLIPIAAGSVYHLTIVPSFMRRLIRYKSLKDIPTSRDLFVALAWGILITFIPQALAGAPAFGASALCCFSLIFVLSYLRSVIFDLRDIEGDRIMGRETLVTIIGEGRMRIAIQGFILLAAAVLIAHPFIVHLIKRGAHHFVKPGSYLMQTIPLLYLFIFMFWNRKNKTIRHSVFNALAEAPFFISGLCAWIAAL